MGENIRNKTGTFLGMEANISAVPAGTLKQHAPKLAPLQSGRGRYVQTSTEASRRKKVEAIREKESYRGFTGLPLNSAQRPKTSPANCHAMRKNAQRETPTNDDILELTRQNSRQFTAVPNNGVVHREYLIHSQHTGEESNSIPPDLAASLLHTSAVKDPAQYYNTLCQNNPEALKTLLTNKKFGWPTNQYTGFHIRSYRKPPTAQIMADLDRVAMPPRRPKTAINLSNKELLVPQPYIYRSASFAARKASQKSARSAVQPQPVTFTDEVFGMFAEKNRSLNTSPDQTSNKLGTVVTPLSPSTADRRPDRVMPIMKKTLVRKDSASSSSDPLVPKINIAIETDDGAPQPLEIDGIEAFRNENSNMEDEKSKDTDIRKHSIAERMQKIKLGEDVANNIKIEAAQRKKALEELLTEHEHLVKQTVSTDSGQQVVSPELAG